ncbi:MAG TPA: VOC family protein [Chloroflexota bacterium]|nr:VOC family protein [Chloroflexota bacterium]
MIKGLTYVILTTSDVPRARRFFVEQLGLSTEDDIGESFSQFTTRDGTQWAVSTIAADTPAPDTPGQAPQDTPSPGIELFLEVDDPDEAYRVWQARGVEVVGEPRDAEWGRSFAFKDPDGRLLHAWRPARPA